MANAQASGLTFVEEIDAGGEVDQVEGTLKTFGAGKQKSNKQTKRKIIELINNRPGCSITEVAGLMGCSHQNASRHLNQLDREGHLDADRSGRDAYFFCSHQTEIHVRLHPYLKDPGKRRVINGLLDHADRAWSLNKIAKESGLCFTSVQRLLEKFKERELVVFEKFSSRYIVKPTPRLTQLLANYDKFAKCLENASVQPPSAVQTVVA